MSDEFITKDSGKRQEFSTGMKRDSGEKPLYTEVYAPLDVQIMDGTFRVSLMKDDLYVCVNTFCKLHDHALLLKHILHYVHRIEACDNNGETLIAGRCLSFDERYAKLMMRGAQKYDRGNWRKAATAEELVRYKDSLHRHTVQYLRGDTDEDHATAIAFNCYGAAMVLDKLKEDK